MNQLTNDPKNSALQHANKSANGSAPDAIADRYVLQGEASASVEKVKLKYGETFVVLDTRGDLPESEQETGMYWRGTRYLRTCDLFVESAPLTGLSHSVSDEEGACQIDLTNPYIPQAHHEGIMHGVVHARRRLTLRSRNLSQQITLTNYNETSILLNVGMLVGADYRDIFEIRGMQCEAHGQLLEPVMSVNEVTLSYLGRDNVARETRIELDPPADEVGPAFKVDGQRRAGAGTLIWRVALGAGEATTLCVTTRLWEGDPKTPEAQRWPNIEREHDEPLRSQRLPSLVSDNTFFNQVLTRGMHDLVMMCARTPEGLYPYGGIPWYVCPFGRDALITSLEFLPWFPEVAHGTLAFLASRQGTKVDAFTEEQPGKILHELRRGELANLREIPFIPYYGTVDATPLFLILLEQYIRWTDDVAFLKRMWPHAVAAARWMVDYGGNGPDGFLRYHRSESTGLVNQGWKDSWDAISHADGRLAEGPIALCEVQSYAYAAYEAMAWLAERAGHANQQQEWRRHASKLRSAFIDKFWWPEQQCYYLALDGAGEPCKVVNSNAGQALWGGIAPKEHAEAIVERLHHSDMYTEWGIRTLSSQAVRYNPMSYHNGSVWPHDTAMIGAGFARYGFREEAARLLGNLYGVSLHYEGARLPELFCGFSRLHGYGPTRYPVACSPQSWAAGAPFLLISSILGFEPDAAHGRIALRRPMLPEWLHRLEMRGLRLGGHNGQLRFDRSGSETAVVLSQYSEIDIQVLPL